MTGQFQVYISVSEMKQSNECPHPISLSVVKNMTTGLILDKHKFLHFEFSLLSRSFIKD